MNEEKTDSPKKRIIGSSVKPCVHDLGIRHFIKVLKSVDPNVSGFDLGVATIDKIIGVAKETKRPGLILAISFRLGVMGLKEIIVELIERFHKEKLDPKSSGIRITFGGTVPVANFVRSITGQPVREDPFAQEEQEYNLEEIAKEYGENPKFKNFFEFIADTKTKKQEVIDFAKPHEARLKTQEKPAQNLIDRIKQVRKNEGRALRRVHIGIAGDLEKTLEAIKKVTEEKVWDIISIAPDQWAQQFLYHFIDIKSKKNPKDYPFAQGGCPIRSKKDLIKLKKASQCGNYPLMRIYSGTDKLIEIGKLFDETINICFPAVPIFWYNQLDGRGPIAIKEGITEHQKVIKFWAKRGKPVEINDPHQWQLRECSDDIYVVDHVLCAIVAKINGVKDYIMQMMFNLPPEINPIHDLAKMKTAYELIKILEDQDFRIIKEVRAGLDSFPDDLDEAAGHLSAGALIQLFMEPDIIHIVSKSEAHHEAGADDIIQSCKHLEGAEKLFRLGLLKLQENREIQKRKLELKRNAVYTLLNIAVLGEYKGEYKYRINLENYDNFLVNEEECETVLKDLINPENYPSKKCNLVNSDVLDLTLRIGLLQAPVIADIDKRYSMVSRCETEIIDGACRTVEFNGEKVENEIQRVKKTMQYYKEQIIGTKVQRKGEILTRGIPKKKVLQARNELMIPKFDNKKVLVVDFGSTFTKLATFNTNNIEKIKFNYIPTTVDDLRRCLAHGLGILNKCLKDDEIDDKKLEQEIKKKYDIRLACSSAKGGLKIVTVSAVEEESGKAAELAAYKAGGKILASYNGKLTTKQAENIYQKDQPELILLTGGVDRGGNTEIVIHNAKQLAEHARLAEYAKYGVPIVYAGTEDAHKKIAYIFTQKNIKVKWAENVMPEINEFNIDAVEDAIGTLFKEIIVKGKGFDKVQKYFQLGLVPTPAAALWGINLLACGYGVKNPGIEDILAFDVGGCTIDGFVVRFRKNPLYEGSDENKRTKDLEPNIPLVIRKVEGKFGLSFNAVNLMIVKRWKEGKTQAFINNEFKRIHPNYEGNDNSILAQFFNPTDKRESVNIAGYLKYLSNNPGFVPKTKEENTLNALIANELLKACTKNNCGKVESTETYYLQKGINFLNMPCTVLLIGGTVYHKCQENTPDALRDLKIITDGALFNPEEPYILRPHKDNIKVLADKDYLIAVIGGRYGKVDPKRALQIMKKHLKEIKL